MTEPPILQAMADDYQTIYGGDVFKRDDQLAKWQSSLNNEVLRQNISNINKIIKQELKDETLHPFYHIACNRKYAGSRYGVRVEKGKISIE